MIHRSKAPLRIGLAGGGTDVSPYADLYGGAILNATLSLYAHASIQPNNTNTIHFITADRNQNQTHPYTHQPLPINGTADLLVGVHNRIQKDHGPLPTGYTLTTFVDAPPGSGLGTSSTLVVAIIGAYTQWLKLPLGEYDIAHYAYQIEREDLKLAGGRQDQYAATFGGVNYMEFLENNKVIVNPLRIKQNYIFELQNNLVLFYTNTSRESAHIINVQSQNVTQKNEQSIEAMHQLKEQAKMMKEALLTGKIDQIGNILNFGFQQKKLMAKGITNPLIDQIYQTALNHGATGGKISGAGGGGFMIFYCPQNTRYPVIQALQQFQGHCYPYTFTNHGLSTWSQA